MLTSLKPDSRNQESRNRRRERRLWNQSELTQSIGCPTCPHFEICGGLYTRAHLFDCMGNCCNNTATCTTMCPLKARDFVDKTREVNGLSLDSIERAPLLNPPNLPSSIPLIYHGNRRRNIYTGPAIALSLYRLLERETGKVKYSSEQELRSHFCISDDTTIILSGTDQDPPLERWWRYGEDRRREAIRSLISLGIRLSTTPNFSMFVDTPRWDDLHAMKRIGIINNEFLQEGLPSALHVNARAGKDQERWTSFVQERPEITHLAYEFATGSGRASRQDTHVLWLTSLANKVDRPLTIIVRGGIDTLEILSSSFSKVVFIDTSPFMKTMNRKRAVLDGNMGLKWEAHTTKKNEALDELFEHNASCRSDLINLKMSTPRG